MLTFRLDSFDELFGGELSDQCLSRPCISNLLDQILHVASTKDFAVFAYGSLIWHPGFKPVFTKNARIYGYKRSACIYSTHYRGTPKKPGLVLGLDRGGSCTGIALGLPNRGRRKIIEKTIVREMFQGVYYPIITRAHCLTNEVPVKYCLTFVANLRSPSYAKDLSSSQIAKIVATTKGMNGPCIDYWKNTCQSLSEKGINWHPGFKL